MYTQYRSNLHIKNKYDYLMYGPSFQLMYLSKTPNNIIFPVNFYYVHNIIDH